MNGSGYFWVETQLKSLSLWSWPQVYRQVCRQTVTESERETPEWSQSPEPTLKTLTESSRPEHEHDRLQPCSQSHRKCVSETGRQWDRQAVSETANSSRVNIWFQSTATNKKCCVFISVWLQLSLTPPTVATAGCGSALSDLHHSLPSVFFTLRCLRVCEHMVSIFVLNRRADVFLSQCESGCQSNFICNSHFLTRVVHLLL